MDEDLANLPLPTAKAIETDAFVPLESVDPIRIAEGYYLQPAGPVAAKPYKLLVKALSRSAKVAVAKYAWSGRERLGLLRVRDDVLVLHAMRWPDEIRDPTELLPPPTEVSEEEIAGALALMDTMTVDALEGPEFTDRYTEVIAQIIEAKREEKPLPEALEPEQPAQPGSDGRPAGVGVQGEGLPRRRRSGRRPRTAAAEEEGGHEEAAGQADRGEDDGGPPAAQRLSPATGPRHPRPTPSQRLAQGRARMSWPPMRCQTMCRPGPGPARMRSRRPRTEAGGKACGCTPRCSLPPPQAATRTALVAKDRERYRKVPVRAR
ncbi:Ku protein [Streptomyces sp. CSDS2]|uniref:Ku protein n=1 Tax=Streptomyces sp. CSDS2 TaxID=3055051 RepID=UPI0025B27988|nr:Ku protein [Streptomyces sp. CSDS2]MDN3264058.1 Ku protein [Streptomyces sp. CSDS2]